MTTTYTHILQNCDVTTPLLYPHPHIGRNACIERNTHTNTQNTVQLIHKSLKDISDPTDAPRVQNCNENCLSVARTSSRIPVQDYENSDRFNEIRSYQRPLDYVQNDVSSHDVERAPKQTNLLQDVKVEKPKWGIRKFFEKKLNRNKVETEVKLVPETTANTQNGRTKTSVIDKPNCSSSEDEHLMLLSENGGSKITMQTIPKLEDRKKYQNEVLKEASQAKSDFGFNKFQNKYSNFDNEFSDPNDKENLVNGYSGDNPVYLAALNGEIDPTDLKFITAAEVETPKSPKPSLKNLAIKRQHSLEQSAARCRLANVRRSRGRSSPLSRTGLSGRWLTCTPPVSTVGSTLRARLERAPLTWAEFATLAHGLSGALAHLHTTSGVQSQQLRARLERAPFTWGAVRHSRARLSGALAHLHTTSELQSAARCGASGTCAVHRELLVRRDGARLADLGLAQVLAKNKRANSACLVEAGTLRYLAPEALDGALDLDGAGAALCAVDVYALGSCCGRCCGGPAARTPGGPRPTACRTPRSAPPAPPCR
ncbi:hypothetical protein MSG28_015033 [Choristoneura fumiferana]|uniref:Uncharacterized protein n=1 Tax=Choristoneura fumiferana TaxID=7141 RepID=A0ACC0KY99_CHOFU|nr:hypothetical protein MSG28_015033 [Choristoneura fumiferana]